MSSDLKMSTATETGLATSAVKELLKSGEQTSAAECVPVRIYTPAPLLDHPVVMIRDLVSDIGRGRELAWRLFVRDLASQYRQTYLGYVWAFLPPLVASFTFIFLQSEGIVKIEGTSIPYPAFAMIGTLLWQVFIDSMASPSTSITSSKAMLSKINFPREALLMAGLYMVVFNFLIRLVLVAAVLCIWQIPVGAGLWLFLPASLALIFCGFAVGLLLLPVGALYGDVAKAIPIVGQFWMLLTPVVYPARTTGLAGWLATWNPVAPVFVTARDSLTGQPLIFLAEAAGVSLVAFFAVLAGLIGFRIAMPHLIARMGG